jgi:cytochrome bd-type quinol oxidase subunit 1
MILDLSRWQFGITTIFHFIFVPLTIGLALLLAIMPTTAYRNHCDPERYEKWSKMTLFWRRPFLINFAIGVANCRLIKPSPTSPVGGPGRLALFPPLRRLSPERPSV